jgi:hypothetical protein
LGGWSSFFLFATLDGTISGWAPQTNFNDAIIAVNNSARNRNSPVSPSPTGLREIFFTPPT